VPASIPSVVAQVLRCPVTGAGLRPLTVSELALLNGRITAGTLRARGGATIRAPLAEGLVEDSGRYAYRVEDGIAHLMADRALRLHGSDAPPDAVGLRPETRNLQSFYDECGWKRTERADFVDAAEWEDLRAVSAAYRHRCHLRVKRYLPPRGAVLLDVGCGPIQYPEYLAYSEGYDYRLCVDVSHQALVEARRKLGGRGVYVIGDVTNLPLAEGTMDAFTCVHMLYHVPADKQLAGLRELYRVLRRGGSGVVVYSWGRHALLMKLALMHVGLPRVVRRHVRWRFAQLRRLMGATLPEVGAAGGRGIYFHAHPYRWWRREAADLRLAVYPWRAVSVECMRRYVHPWLLGGVLLRLVWWAEEAFARLMGRVGQYPLFVLRK
jgi:ubiquinone/menaquinone biosynthesis C-methylase UbiE